MRYSAQSSNALVLDYNVLHNQGCGIYVGEALLVTSGRKDQMKERGCTCVPKVKCQYACYIHHILIHCVYSIQRAAPVKYKAPIIATVTAHSKTLFFQLPITFLHGSHLYLIPVICPLLGNLFVFLTH